MAKMNYSKFKDKGSVVSSDKAEVIPAEQVEIFPVQGHYDLYGKNTGSDLGQSIANAAYRFCYIPIKGVATDAKKNTCHILKEC